MSRSSSVLKADREDSPKLPEDRSVLGIIGKIGEFMRVGVVVVKFEAVFAFVPLGAAPTGGTDGAAPEFSVGTTAGLGEGGIVKLKRDVV